MHTERDRHYYLSFFIFCRPCLRYGGMIKKLKARVAELADALDLESSAQAWGFESPPSHQRLRRDRAAGLWTDAVELQP